MAVALRQIKAGLQDSVSAGVYDKTKTSALGRAFQKVIGSTTVIAPPLSAFIDQQTTLGVVPAMIDITPNGRLFIISAVATGVAVVSYYDFDMTGQTAPVVRGKINVNLANAAATTHTLRMFKVYDGASSATVTGWRILIGTTGSVLINGGLFVVNNVAQADFSILSAPTIGLAIASNAKAVYFQQDTAAIGVSNNITAIQGGALDRPNQKLYVHNNVLATHQFIAFDISAAQTISIQTTTAATVSASPTFTMTGHGYAANDPVVITSNAPTGFTASTTTTQTVYFVRNPTANTFELSATSGGASINATSVTSGTTVARAFGTSTSSWLTLRTGTISGVSGTILTSNSENYCVPVNADPAVNGQPCIFFATTTNFYLFKVSDITNGATSFASLRTVNVSGSLIEYTAIQPIQALYSSDLDQVVYVSNVNVVYTKSWLSGVIAQNFGGTVTKWLETPSTPVTVPFSSVTAIALAESGGWLFSASSTAGQRGVLFCDAKSDTAYGFSSVITKVLSTAGCTLKNVSQIEALFELTNVNRFFYRTASTAGDALFNSASGGWIEIFEAEESAIILDAYTQFKIENYIISPLGGTPAQSIELLIGVLFNTDMSDNWALVVDGTTQGAGSPSDTIFELRKAYASVVPNIRVQDIDKDTLVQVSALTTAANPTNFAYSTDTVTYLPLGTIPNTVGTRLRVRRSLPGGTEAVVAAQEV